jgi:hypothetical protein
VDNLPPLAESDPAQRTPARRETPAAEAAAWLADPQPPPPPETLHEQIAREIAEAIGWPLEQTQEAITELHEHDPEKRKCAESRPTR